MSDRMEHELGDKTAARVPAGAVFAAFLRLGLTSFGGPIAHLGYFREEFVTRKRWINEQAYADLVALCQFLPGPASSQVGISIGLAKAGLPGAFAAWFGFTVPSALALVLFGYGVITYHDAVPPGLLHGLKIVAVAVVAQAISGMARVLCTDTPRRALAIIAAIGILALPSVLALSMAWVQVGVIALGALAGMVFLKAEAESRPSPLGIEITRGVALTALVLFFVILVGLPIAATAYPNQTLALIDGFYRSGALVFGGGHVVLPLLQAEVVPSGWVSKDAFLAGYGAAQAVPGPLFTFAAFLGAVMTPAPNGWIGALICLLAIFAPSFLLVVGVLPFWDRLRRFAPMGKALMGVNAAVVGLLLAALYDPVWTGAIGGPGDFALALAAFGLLAFCKVPPWAVVTLTALGGWAIAALPGITG